MTDEKPFNLFHPGFSQTCYVTNDFDRAAEKLNKIYKIKEWWSADEFTFPTRDGKTVTNRLGLTYVGETQFELIQPLGGDTVVYDSLLGGDGFQMNLHHFCEVFETPEEYHAKLADLQAEGIDIPISLTPESSETGVALACYADMRHECGHYLEYVWFNERGRAWMATVPRI